MTDVRDYAKRDCSLCGGTGEVPVPDRMWKIRAVCSCVNPRPPAPAVLGRASAMRAAAVRR